MSDERLIRAARDADEATDWRAAIERKNDFKKWKNRKAKQLGGKDVAWALHQADRNLADEQQ